MDRIMARVAGSRITPVGMHQHVLEETGTNLHITYIRKIMHQHGLSPKVAQKIHVNRADRKVVWNRRYYLQTTNFVPEKGGICRAHAG